MIKKILILLVIFFLSTPITGESAMSVSEPKSPLKFEAGKKYIATIKTKKGNMVFELNQEAAPLSVTNFVQLAHAKFYNGLTFHRVVPGFVVQGGDPQGNGTGGPGYTVKAEISLPHKKGDIAWARTGDQINPERRSSGSQFYICLEDLEQLDNQYTVFGKMLTGQDVMGKIVQGDVMESVSVEIR